MTVGSHWEEESSLPFGTRTKWTRTKCLKLTETLPKSKNRVFLWATCWQRLRAVAQSLTKACAGDSFMKDASSLGS